MVTKNNVAKLYLEIPCDMAFSLFKKGTLVLDKFTLLYINTYITCSPFKKYILFKWTTETLKDLMFI
ncbi:hypothetical protein, partial [Bacillus wiedmannii]|uniref:hypothetical protein n=1 Tax=Bacillus wiedmannii TaxID=1890302 RepID=UPI001C557E75